MNKFFKPKNIEERKLQLEEDKITLQKVYFSLYDQLSEPYKTQTKDNFDIDFAMRCPIPKTISEAIFCGFYWHDTPENRLYWAEITKRNKSFF